MILRSILFFTAASVVGGCSSTGKSATGIGCVGMATCDDVCVDTATDAMNCGACGSVCSVPNATAACVGGSCAVGKCADGFADCDKLGWNGCESKLASDAQNCGACGSACFLPNAASYCADGKCGFAACNMGFVQCLPDGGPVPDGGVLDGGCEVNENDDVMNCGGCGVVCVIEHGTPACVEGKCIATACEDGWAGCPIGDAGPAPGCMTSLDTDQLNCGLCGHECTGSEICSMGICQ